MTAGPERRADNNAPAAAVELAYELRQRLDDDPDGLYERWMDQVSSLPGWDGF